MNNNSEYCQALKVRPSLRSFRVIFQKSETQKSEKDGGTEVEIGNGYFKVAVSRSRFKRGSKIFLPYLKRSG